MIIDNKKIHFSSIILLILVTTLFNSTNYSDIKINE